VTGVTRHESTTVTIPLALSGLFSEASLGSGELCFCTLNRQLSPNESGFVDWGTIRWDSLCRGERRKGNSDGVKRERTRMERRHATSDSRAICHSPAERQALECIRNLKIELVAVARVQNPQKITKNIVFFLTALTNSRYKLHPVTLVVFLY
jgi:hypothetical protein